MLYAFDHKNPLSKTAQDKLLEYQKTSPPVAYTTSELQESASKGLIKAMVMEEQAYINTPELQDYVYTPVGIRHDHPVYTFSYVSKEKQEAAKLFVDYCLDGESQKLAKEKGFNRHASYKEQSAGLNGAGYLSAQKIWKTNKSGGQPIIATFVADISGSMAGEPINSMKNALLATSSYIGSDNYVGLVSYADEVHIDLPIAKFDDEQRAYFSGAVKAITKACAYIKSITDVSKFDKDKFESAFSGSVYVKAGKLSNDTKLGYMHLNLFQKDIRTRGWDSKDKFLSALNEMNNLLPTVKGLKDSVKRLKDSSTKDADKKAIKMYSLYTKQTLKYTSFLGRGIVAASKRMCSGALGKIFADSK